MTETDLQAVEARHRQLDKEIRIEAARHVPDEDRLHILKKEKLRLKDILIEAALSPG